MRLHRAGQQTVPTAIWQVNMAKASDAILVKIDALQRAIAEQLGKESKEIDPSTLAISLLALDVTAEFFRSIFEMQALMDEINERMSLIQKNGF